MASIEQLKSEVARAKGMAAANQYAVQLPSIKGYEGRSLNLLCKSVTLPGKQVTTKDRMIGLFNEKIADGFINDDVTMTFYVLNDYHTRLYFDAWRSLIIDEKNGTVNYKNDYAKTIQIHQLKREDGGGGLLGKEYSFGVGNGLFSLKFDFFANAIYSVKLLNAFPTTISSVELTNEPNGLVEMTVQFSYTNWEVKKDLLSKLNRGIKLDIGGIL